MDKKWTALWIVRYIPLLKECLPTTELLRQRLDISDKYTITLTNKFDALQEISETLTPNDEYENFVNAHMEAVAECIPIKLKAKQSSLGDISCEEKTWQHENRIPNKCQHLET